MTGTDTPAVAGPPEAADRPFNATHPAEGEMAGLTRAMDWSATPVGPMAEWPGSLRSAVEIMLASRYPMLIWWGPELIQFYNDAYTPVMGARHPWGLGKPAPVIWSEAWPTVGPLAEAVMRDGVSTWSERLQIVMTRNGYPEEVYMTFSYSPIRGEDGGIAGLFCACTEETQRVLGERRLRALRDLAGATAEAKTVEEACAAACASLEADPQDLPFALLYLLDADGRAATLAGLAGDLDRDSPAAPAHIGLAESGGSAWPLAEVLRTRKPLVLDDLAGRFGAPLPSRAWPEPVERAVVLPLARPGRDTLAGLLVAGVSPRLVLDEGYRDFLGLLAGQAATAISNARAYEEERRRAEALAELDRAKTTFFSNVSHEFRTPLTLTLGPLEEVLGQPSLGAEERARVEVAHRNGLRLLRLVNSLLDFSRVEAGRAQASYRATDLAASTAELASNFRSACERAGLRLAVDCPPLPEPVWLDRDMWEKVVLNLLSNAFKFTFRGEIAVTARARDGAAEVVVRDTGTGIPAAELPRVFERFHRVENARARTHEGTGIGLALVQELVRLHGGTIEVASTLGEGTAFTLRIPFGTAHLPADRIDAAATLASTATRAEAFVEEALRWLPDGGGASAPVAAPAPEPEAVAPAPSAVQPARPGGGSERRPRVLLADDNADMRDHVRRILSARFEVEAVGDGRAALDAAEARRPDLLLADVMMPGLDGFGLLRAVRASPALRHLPVVLLSARAGEEARVEGLEAGADDYLVKPFGARELLARVTANLEMTRARREAAEAALRESEAWRRTLSEALPQLIWSARRGGEWDWAGPQWRAYTGLDEAASLGRGWLRAVHPGDVAPLVRAWREASEEGLAGELDLEVRLRGRRGAWRWFQLRAVPVPIGGSGDGGEPRWLGTCTDVDDLKRAEARLAAELADARLLQALSTRLIPEHEPDALHGQILDAAAALARADAASLQTLEPGGGGRLRRLASRGLHPASEAYWERVDASHASTCGRALRANARVVVEDVEASAELAGTRDLEEFRRSGIRAVQSTPLVSRSGRPIGLLSTHWHAPRRLSEAEFGLFDVLARQAADLIERAGGEAALRESEEKYRTLFDAIDEGFAVFDMIFDAAGKPVDFRYAETNAAFEAQTGRRPRPGQTMREVFPEAEGMWLELYAAVARTGRAERFVDFVEGLGRWFDVYVFPTGVPGGNRLAALFADVTERKRAEAALRESEERFRTLADAAPALIWRNDADGRNLYLNRHFLDFTGRTAEEIRGEGWHALVHPDGAAAYIAGYLAAVSGRRAWHDRNRIRRRDGVWRWFDNYARPLFGSDGAYLGHVGVSIDVTAAVEAEAALRASEGKYRSLFESIDEGYLLAEVVFDEGERPIDILFLEANPAAIRLAGREFTGRRMREVDPGYEEHWVEIYGRVALTGEPVRAEHYAEPHGRWFDFRASRAGGPESRRVAVVFQDTTERKRAEEALRESEERQAFLLRLSDALRPVADPVAIQETASRMAAEHLDIGRVAYCEIRYEPDIVVVVERDWPRRGMPSVAAGRYRMDDFGPFLARELTAGRPAIVADAATDPRLSQAERGNWGRFGIAASCALPVMKEGRFVAYLVAQDNRRHVWTDRETALLRDVSERTWAAVERARAEAALRESEARLRAALSISTVGVLFWGPAASLTDANEAFLRMSGFGREEALGKGWRDLTPPEFHALSERVLEEVAARGESAPFEKQYLRKDGSRWWGLFAPRRIGDGVVEFVIDITERKRAEAALRESEARFRRAVSVPKVGVLFFDLAGRIHEANAAFEQMCGYTTEELRSTAHWDRLTAPEFHAVTLERARDLAERGETPPYEKQMVRGDGTRWWGLFAPTRLGGHGPESDCVEFVFDITETKRAQEALRESEARFRALVTAGANMVYRMSPDWRQMYQLDGHNVLADTAEPVEDWADSYLLPEDREHIFAAIEAAKRGKTLFELEHRVRRADGSIGWVVSRAAPILGPDGEIVEWFGAGSDVTERREAVERLREREATYRAELERRVEERTAELKRSRDLLQATMDSSMDMIQVFEAVRDEAGRIVDFRWVLNNHTAERQYGGDVVGRSLLRNNPGVVEAGIFDTFKRVVETGEPDRSERHYVHERFDGWFLQSTVKLGDGVATTTSDITERKRAEQEVARLGDEVARARLHESEERLRSLVQGIPQLVWRATGGGAWTWASQQWAAFTGRAEEASRGHGWLKAVHPGDRGAVLAAWSEAEEGGAFRADHRLWHAAEGRYRWVQSQALPVRDGAGGIAEWLGTTTDVEELRRAQEQRILIEELHHRGRNLLAVVGGIAEQTLATSGSPEEFGARFEERLGALGRVQGLLSREVAPNVTVGELLRMELAAHGVDDGDRQRVRLDGPELVLPARSVQPLALALHELLTNALKHGALGASEGRLAITWGERRGADGSRRLWLDWVEGGVAISDTAPRRGFGLDLIEQSLPYELDADTRLAFGPDGLRCTIELPLDDEPAAEEAAVVH